MPNSSPSLFITLEAKPQVYVLSNPPSAEVLLGASSYRLVDSEIGFYDFLRDHEKTIIGIRFSPFDHQPILDCALPLSYTYVDRKRGYMEVYLRGHRGLSILGSAEQDFGDDAVWRNQTGTYALQLGTTALTKEELNSLRALVVG